MDGSDWSDRIEEAQEIREQERHEVIKNPDPDEEHHIFSLVSVDHKWHYDYDPEIDEIEFSHEERIEDGTNHGEYRCTCCTYEMSSSEALQHIKIARSTSD